MNTENKAVSKSYFVGDSDGDMLCAKNAGLQGLRYEGGSLLDLVQKI